MAEIGRRKFCGAHVDAARRDLIAPRSIVHMAMLGALQSASEFKLNVKGA